MVDRASSYGGSINAKVSVNFAMKNVSEFCRDLVPNRLTALGQLINHNVEWRSGRPAQVTVPVAEMVAGVQDILKSRPDAG